VFGNIHNPTDSTPNSSLIRYANALLLRSTAQNWINQGYPVVYTGDYNSLSEIRVPQDSTYIGTNRNKLPYCAFGATGSMAHAYDLLLKRNKADGTCPAANLLIKIDQIWVNTDSRVTNYNPFQSNDVSSATDHPHVPYADVVPEAAN
jgi:endonuclease/exonuclease/phosphatase family metal-dependent hydrolase